MNGSALDARVVRRPLAAAPSTLPVPAEKHWPVAAGGATLTARVPAHPRLHGLLAFVGFPVTASSAEASGEAPFLEPHDSACWLAELDHVES